MKRIASNSSMLRSRFLSLVVFSLFSTVVVSADELDQIRAEFDSLSTSFAELKQQGETINGKVAKFGNYLDVLATTPSTLSGKDLDAVFDAGSDLTDEQWDELMELKSSEMTELLANDTEISQSVDQIDVEVDDVAAELDKATLQIDELQTKSVNLVGRIVDYTDGKPFRAARLLPLTLRIKGLSGDFGDLAKSVPDTLSETGSVLHKIDKVNEMKKASGSTSGGTVGSATVEAGQAATQSTASGNSSTASSPPQDTGFNKLFFGVWQESGSSDKPVQLLLSTPALGQASGFVVSASAGLPVQLTLTEQREDQYVYSDDNTGNLYHVTAFDDQLILKSSKADGTKIYQIFLERP